MYSGLAQPDVQYSDFEGQLIVRPKDREKLQIGLTQNQVQFKPSLREHIISKSMLKAAPSHSGALSYGHEFEKAYDVSGASYSEGMKQDVTFLNDSPTKINKARVAIPSGQACFSNSPRVEHERPSSPEIQRMDDMSERACIPSADISPEIELMFRSIFEVFDLEQKGHLSWESLEACLGIFGSSTSSAPVKNLMERFCPTHSESISCSQFKAILARNLAENPALLKPCFLDFDICGAGEVTLEDLKIISGELGLYLSHSKLQAMISEFGKSKPGCITESEFALLAESIK